MDVSNLHTGSYRTFLAYRKAEVIYDLTYYFCGKYLHRGDRTIDQMVQAARSGKQNIIEGKEAARTSYETLLKLINVARSSLQELLADYEDYLRVRHLRQWPLDSAEVKAMRKLGREHNEGAYFLSLAQTRSDEVVANMVIVLIYQADALLNGYFRKRYNDFLQEGGFRERLTRERLAHRNKEK
jgi:four helix bundle suffix protein